MPEDFIFSSFSPTTCGLLDGWTGGLATRRTGGLPDDAGSQRQQVEAVAAAAQLASLVRVSVCVGKGRICLWGCVSGASKYASNKDKS